MSAFGSPFVVNTKVGGIIMDVTLDEDHVYESVITDNPVEDGTVYSDHIILLPGVLNLVARVSDAAIAFLGIPKLAQSIDAYRELVQLQAKREPFSVVTGIGDYENMVLQNLSVPRTAQDGQSLRFNMRLREILIVGDETQTNRDRIVEELRHSGLNPIDNGYVQKVA